MEDLLSMLEIVPFGSLLHKKTVLLNPTFEESSVLVGGADADLIAGDLLIDFKVTKMARCPRRIWTSSWATASWPATIGGPIRHSRRSNGSASTSRDMGSCGRWT